MMMGPGGMQGPARIHPDQLANLLRPVVESALRTHEAGVPLPALLHETALAAFLVGAGMTPAQALPLVREWRRGDHTGAGMEHRSMELFHPTYEAQRKPERPAPTGREQLLQSIRSAMQDEASAAVFYTELMKRARDETVQDYIKHARDDERKHYRMLGELYREITGQTYEVQGKETEIITLRESLKTAMDREYEAAEEYRTIYLEYPQERIRRVFFELMTDEMEHVTRFNYALDVERVAGEQ